MGVERVPRLTVEVFPEHEEASRRVRAAAALKGETLREWVWRALLAQLEQEREGQPRGA